MVVGYIFFCACVWLVEMQELQDRVAKSKDSNEELMKVGREIVDFHGEMVLLENYSALNYTGIFLSLGIDLVLNLSKSEFWLPVFYGTHGIFVCHINGVCEYHLPFECARILVQMINCFNSFVYASSLVNKVLKSPYLVRNFIW